MRYSNLMKGAVVAVVVLLSATGVRAQHNREHGSAPATPPAPFVPQTLSTGGITTLPPPPPASPFAAPPGTYAPRYNQLPPFRAGPGPGMSIYNGTLGLYPYATFPPTPVSDQRVTPAAPAPEPPKAVEAPKPAPPLPE